MPEAPDRMAATYSLREALPTDVVAHSAGYLGSHRNYAVYSAPWFWRRTSIFAPVAATIGLANAVVAGAALQDWTLAIKGAAMGVPIWIALVTVGPALAMLVRHRRWSPRAERAGILSAIAIGVVVSFTLQFQAETFTNRIMQAHRDPAEPQREPVAAVVGIMRTFQFAVFFSLGGGLALPAYFREQRRWKEMQHERELGALRRAKTEADLKLTVLQAQVEPHFLFNTLASIHSLIKQDPQRAEETVEALVAHLRATMPKLRAGMGSTHSTLAEQLEICESYLNVMQIRMAPRLRYEIDVPAELSAHPFPSYTLISLVENAIKHGIEPKPSSGNIVISARTERRGDVRQLAVSVIDDGVGLKPGAGTGVGLENIRAQLATLFGSDAGLSIRARSLGGVEATIRVPYVEARS